MTTSEPIIVIPEKDLAALLRVDRAVLKKMRAPGGPLIEGRDWENHQPLGTLITPEGRKKIEAALRVPPEPTPPASELRDITIARTCVNPLTVHGVSLEPGTPMPLVRLTRGSSPFYRPGQVLKACRPLPYAGQWAYDGPKPRRDGTFPSPHPACPTK